MPLWEYGSRLKSWCPLNTRDTLYVQMTVSPIKVEYPRLYLI